MKEEANNQLSPAVDTHTVNKLQQQHKELDQKVSKLAKLSPMTSKQAQELKQLKVKKARLKAQLFQLVQPV